MKKPNKKDRYPELTIAIEQVGLVIRRSWTAKQSAKLAQIRDDLMELKATAPR